MKQIRRLSVSMNVVCILKLSSGAALSGKHSVGTNEHEAIHSIEPQAERSLPRSYISQFWPISCIQGLLLSRVNFKRPLSTSTQTPGRTNVPPATDIAKINAMAPILPREDRLISNCCFASLLLGSARQK